ncbi:hypothetical protein O9993_12115 [Vibrio lentus]|nr:hypothetical protein [Vibrio lentus]
MKISQCHDIIIYIALPNHVHHEYVIKAAQKGKRFFVKSRYRFDMEKTEQLCKNGEKTVFLRFDVYRSSIDCQLHQKN